MLALGDSHGYQTSRRVPAVDTGPLFHWYNRFQQTLKMPYLMKAPGAAAEAANRLEARLREAPFLSDATISREGWDSDSGVDFILTVRSGSMNRRLVCL